VGKLLVGIDPQRGTQAASRTLERLVRAARALRAAARTAAIEWKSVTHDETGDTLSANVTFRVEVEKDTVDGGYVASCLNLPGCFSQGATEEEAVRNIVEAIAGVMEARMERGIRDRPLHPVGEQPDSSRPHRHELLISA
jgi:predicted RNase H-like HicB family nuclease